MSCDIAYVGGAEIESPAYTVIALPQSYTRRSNSKTHCSSSLFKDTTVLGYCRIELKARGTAVYCCTAQVTGSVRDYFDQQEKQKLARKALWCLQRGENIPTTGPFDHVSSLVVALPVAPSTRHTGQPYLESRRTSNVENIFNASTCQLQMFFDETYTCRVRELTALCGTAVILFNGTWLLVLFHLLLLSSV